MQNEKQVVIQTVARLNFNRLEFDHRTSDGNQGTIASHKIRSTRGGMTHGAGIVLFDHRKEVITCVGHYEEAQDANQREIFRQAIEVAGFGGRNVDSEFMPSVAFVQVIHKNTGGERGGYDFLNIFPTPVKADETKTLLTVTEFLDNDLDYFEVVEDNSLWTFKSKSTDGVSNKNTATLFLSLTDPEHPLIVKVNGGNRLNLKDTDEYVVIAEEVQRMTPTDFDKYLDDTELVD